MLRSVSGGLLHNRSTFRVVEMTRGSTASSPLAVLFQKHRKILLRDYIQKSLYDPKYGYFAKQKSPLLQHCAPLHLSSMKNSLEYQSAVAKTYASSSHGWMTPVELFSPYFSRAIANRLKSLVRRNKKINIVEIGAGRGTLARDILSHWEATDQQLLSQATYYVVEISKAMMQLQKVALQKWIDRGVVILFNADALDWFSSLRSSSQFESLADGDCHILGTEVLDNMPHDLVRICGDRLEQAELFVTSPEPGKNPGLRLTWNHLIDAETMEAIQGFGLHLDSLIRRHEKRANFSTFLRDRFEELIGGGFNEVWVPTTSYRLLRAIVKAVPQASFTLSDFDSLPGSLQGINGPVVQSINRGSTSVFDSILHAPFGEADIMFPARFDWLSHGHALLSEKVQELTECKKSNFSRRILTQPAFFAEYSSSGDRRESTCRDGYNPILREFLNASFLLVD